MIKILNQHISKDNSDSIIIYRFLLKGFNEIEKKLKPQINIISLFFHQLMKILTSYTLKKNEIQSRYKPDNTILEFPVNDFPYISYHDLFNDIDYGSKNYLSTKYPTSYRRFFSSYVKNLKSNQKVKIGVVPGAIKNAQLLRDLNKEYKIIILDDLKMSIENFDDQFKLLSISINEIFHELHYNYDPSNMIKLVKKHIITKIGEGSNYVDVDIVITGTMGKLIAVKYGAHMRNLEKPVISIMHGEGDQLLYDEPLFGYGDRTFCSHFFGFGNNFYNSSKTNFLTSLYKEPQYISSNSNFINKIFSNQKIDTIRNFQSAKWLYAPDSLLHHRRYGPFGGSIPAKLYMEWQKKVMNLFRLIYYKKHPKGHSLFKNISIEELSSSLSVNKKNILTDNFNEVYTHFDGYIFDHISTVFMIAAATNKPIIYFNIGKRNFTDYAQNFIKNRCHWIDVDPANPIDLEEKIESIKNKVFSNDITPGFSLDHGNIDITREQKLFNTIESLL